MRGIDTQSALSLMKMLISFVMCCELQSWDEQMLCEPYLQQAEHGVAYIEAMPPVVVGDGPVALPHCVHPSGQGLVRGRGDCRTEKIRRADKGLCYSFFPSAWGNPHHCSHSTLSFGWMGINPQDLFLGQSLDTKDSLHHQHHDEHPHHYFFFSHSDDSPLQGL